MPGDQLAHTRVVVDHQDRRSGQTLIRPAQRPPLSRSQRGLSRSPGRHRKGESAAQARLAQDRDGPSVHRYQPAHDAQAEAGPTVPAGTAAVALHELFEDDFLLLSTDADAGNLY